MPLYGVRAVVTQEMHAGGWPSEHMCLSVEPEFSVGVEISTSQTFALL